MRLQRALGLVMMGTMTHLVLVGSDLVCAKHSVSAGASTMLDMQHGSHRAPEPQKTPCDGSGSGDCCSLVPSCAPLVALTSTVSGPVRQSVHVAPSAPAVDDAPAMQIVAPDPPPPKI